MADDNVKPSGFRPFFGVILTMEKRWTDMKTGGWKFFPSLQILSSWWIISFERPDLPRGRVEGEERRIKRSCENGPANYIVMLYFDLVHTIHICVCVYVYVCQNRGYCGTYLLYKDILMQWRFRVKTCSVIFHATAYSLPDHLEHYQYSVKCFVVRTHSGRKYWYTC